MIVRLHKQCPLLMPDCKQNFNYHIYFNKSIPRRNFDGICSNDLGADSSSQKDGLAKGFILLRKERSHNAHTKITKIYISEGSTSINNIIVRRFHRLKIVFVHADGAVRRG